MYNRGVPRKERIDVLLVQRGLAESRSFAQRLVMAGQVRADGQVVVKSSQKVETGAKVEVAARPQFVSRGGEKLEAALAEFPVTVKGKVCADVGASTGGFTDCLLQHGAGRVYAVDVGHGVLHWSLRNHERVVVMERTNARKLASLPEQVSLVTVDASFISLRLLLPSIVKWLSQPGDVLALIKPQFEAGKKAVGRGGVVKDPDVHREVVQRIAQAAEELGLSPQGLMRSPLLGPKGNVEFMFWCRLAGDPVDAEGLRQGLFSS